MRVSFTVLFLLTISIVASAQERLITGVLRSSDGEPMPGVNITIKGTTTGTTTDADGRYSIRVPVGSTLVFSFIGMQTREVVVGADGTTKPREPDSKPAKRAKKEKSTTIPRSLLTDTLPNAPGVVTLTDDSPTHNGKLPANPGWITGFRRYGNRYRILTYSDFYKQNGYGVQFTTTIGIDQPTSRPSLQSTYAQGRPDNGTSVWRGAHQGEIFSWGPAVNNLEYDGQSYGYDNNGMLVQTGTGNGKQANTYNANIFRTGITNASQLILMLAGPSQSTILFDAESRIRSGIIPNASYKRFNGSLHLKDLNIKRIKLNSTVTFNDSRGTLLPHGANLSSIVGASYRTPTTFDNSNGLSTRMARSSQQAFRLEDGNIRSHAPGVADNPFGLINELPDRDHLQRLIGMIDARIIINNDLVVNVSGNTDWQSSMNVFGIPAGYSGYPAGRMTGRQDQQWLSGFTIAPGFQPDVEKLITLGAAWQLNHDQREVTRTDGFYFPGKTDLIDAGLRINSGNSLSRSTHEVSAKAEYDGYGVNVKFNARSYFSNTVSTKKYTNILPSAAISLNLADVLQLYSLHVLKVYTTYARTLREAPLVYSTWSHLSTTLAADQYNTFYEDRELYFNRDLIPESEEKFEAGLRMSTGRLSLEFAYFNNYTDDFIAPVFDAGEFLLRNTAAIKNYGSTISLDYDRPIPNGLMSTQLRWTKSYSRTMRVYGGNDVVPIAGFATAQGVLSPGEPVGAIYGTTHLRNENGEHIIGNDGFPIEDQRLTMIGDPLPDWTLGWSAQLNIKRFGVSFLFDFKRGGDVWNGTQAALDYLGRSAASADLRSTTGYVFNGVDENNLPNTTPVSFADPNEPIASNRWARYGWDGIGEDYIEDASWIRLSEVNLSYSIRRYRVKAIKEIKFNLIGRNLFLITPYSGVDPSSTLFGYATGTGLDLFNTPAVRSYNLQVTFKI